MISIQELWDRLRLAQEKHNVDVALCYRHAVDAYNRSDYPSVLSGIGKLECANP